MQQLELSADDLFIRLPEKKKATPAGSTNLCTQVYIYISLSLSATPAMVSIHRYAYIYIKCSTYICDTYIPATPAMVSIHKGRQLRAFIHE
jgi:hypothetical protein